MRHTVKRYAAMAMHRLKDALRSCSGRLFIVAYRGSPTSTALPVSPSHPEGGDQLRTASLNGSLNEYSKLPAANNMPPSIVRDSLFDV